MSRKNSAPYSIAATADVPRPHSKTGRLLDALGRGSGASLEEMMQATGWQAHTVRAAMTGLRKRGFAVTRHVEGNTTVWAVAAREPASNAPAEASA